MLQLTCVETCNQLNSLEENFPWRSTSLKHQKQPSMFDMSQNLSQHGNDEDFLLDFLNFTDEVPLQEDFHQSREQKVISSPFTPTIAVPVTASVRTRNEYPIKSESMEAQIKLESHDKAFMKTEENCGQQKEAPVTSLEVKFEAHLGEHLQKKRRRSTTTSVASISSTKGQPTRWSDQEEVILQGVVTDCNLIYAGQTPWETIRVCYKAASEKFAALNTLALLPDRTSCALKKHYRVMHAKTKSGEVRKDFWYQVYHRSWMSENYNNKSRLIDYSDFDIL